MFKPVSKVFPAYRRSAFRNMLSLLMARLMTLTGFAMLALSAEALPEFKSAASVNTGFEIGNELTAVYVEGSVTVFCWEPGRGQETGRFRCSAEILNPYEFSRFQTESGIDADRVILTARHEDGSSRTKDGKFNPSTGKSHSEFNLWVHTVLQRPLLEMGINKVTYVLNKANREVKAGEFTAVVERGPDRHCPHAQMNSNRLSDCRTSGDACREYFRRFNYCQ